MSIDPAKVLSLLRENIAEYGQSRVDRYRAKAGLTLRKMRLENRALAGWMEQRRETIEADVRHAVARMDLPTANDVKVLIRNAIMDALGVEEKVYSEGTPYARPYKEIVSPGYAVSVGSTFTYANEAAEVSIEIATDKDGPVYFFAPPEGNKREQLESRLKSIVSVSSYADEARREITKELSGKHLLYKIRFEVPVVTDVPGGGPSDAAKPTEALRRPGENDSAFNNRMNRAVEKKHERLFVPFLASGDLSFQLEFLTAPTRKSEYWRSAVKYRQNDVTLETLADVIYEKTGVGFPRSPYFQG